ncbi:MAG: M24 family metallopeptidase [Pseudonocardiaceae bacterium]|nr:M24 family metallopeptidase [Pseudonocardiaceae bacterium]
MASTITHVPNVTNLRTRLARAAGEAEKAGADALLIAPGSDLRYLLGVAGGSFERLTCLVVPSGSRSPLLVVPKLEAPGYQSVPVGELGVELATWEDGQDPFALAAGAAGAAGAGRRVAISDTTPAMHVFGFRDALPGAEQMLAGPIVREMRMRKDAAEVDALREAGAAIDRVHARMGEWLRPGRTEAEVGADIAGAIVAEGHTLAEFVIVGSGPNGASPHHALSDRVIQRGDLVVVDIGGPMPSGYCSDSTRTYAIGDPPAEVAEKYTVLEAAQRAAVDAVRPGGTAQDVDVAARSIITEAGFGERFIHRTGHGIGLDVHEEPYIMTGNELPLDSGMVFSVEPGIYFAGEWGARIEDIVVVTESGVEALNRRPRSLTVLDG